MSVGWNPGLHIRSCRITVPILVNQVIRGWERIFRGICIWGVDLVCPVAFTTEKERLRDYDT